MMFLWQQKPISRKLLPLTDGEMERYGVSSGTVSSREELIASYGFTPDETVVLDKSPADSLITLLSGSMITSILIIAGLVAGKQHMSPVPYADVVTTTTHKTLRGPRGGMILCKEEHLKAINKAVFPGFQGGPHMHTISALAVALGEAMSPDFAAYAAQIVANAKRLAEKLMSYGFDLVSGGTDNHLILIDLRNKNLTGKPVAKALDKAHIVMNYNSVPGDTAGPFNPSGLRMGTPAVTTRGMKEEQMDLIAGWINTICENLDEEAVISNVGRQVEELCEQFPLPESFIQPQ